MIDHVPGDLVCEASADVGLAELQARLARAGQMLAVDPPGTAALTVGELFDGNLSGPRSHRYGEPRDLVLGMTVELADGTVARAGGRVVKNVAGYDLARLFTGARGRLGAIRQVAMRLHPLPASTCTLVAPLRDPAPLERLAPTCVEVAWPPKRMLVRFESPAAAALARAARDRVGGELVADDESLWAEHRELARGCPSFRCPPAEALATADALIASGASRVVGRLARGVLAADAPVAAPAPDPSLAALERRVVEAFGG